MNKKCYSCGGSGKSKCSGCNGTGTTQRMHPDSYKGWQLIPCPSCRGTGFVSCLTCGGTGKRYYCDLNKRTISLFDSKIKSNTYLH